MKYPKWIPVSERLPENRTYVFGRHNLTNWYDTDHQDGLQFIVVKFVKGISLEERENMEDCERRRTFTAGDEWSNNLVPYEWKTFGATTFFGQEITHWMPLPDAPVE